jgi:ATP-dependent Clp protease ATP-binding subunit ClpA
MFERFTDRARRVLVIAQDEARAMEHNFLGTEHILLGLIKEGEGVAAKALTELGADHAMVRAKVLDVVKMGAPGAASGAPPFTPRSKKVLELSLNEALQMSHNYIGTEHLLLGLIREGEGVAAQVLVSVGLDLSTVRAKVISLLHGYAAANPTAMSRTTPAGTTLSTRAKALAGTEAVGSHHYLLGILEDAGSLGARVLSSLGVTAESIATRIKEIGVGGTTDEVPPLKPASSSKPFQFRFGEGVELHIADEDVAVRIAKALQTAKDAGGALGSALTEALAGDEAPDVAAPTENDSEERSGE